jgi:hypothetical protein
MGTPHLAMALNWWVGWPHWPTGKFMDGAEQFPVDYLTLKSASAVKGIIGRWEITD